MTRPDADDRKDGEPIVLGTPEGDGDFESDGLPETGETSAGGQPRPGEDLEVESGTEGPEPKGIEKVIDEISHGTLQP
jgi:hypothetical protein